MSRREAIGLTVFFLIAFGIPWVGWTVLERLDPPYWLFPTFCSIAGFVASYAEGGADGLRRFCQRTLHVRGTAKFIFLAALIPMMLGLLYLLGANAPFSLLQPALKPGLAMTLAMALVTGPLAEEFGWRGYLQDKLLRYMRPLWVALTVGVI
jgi:membrane protease YdiL (CAAX protease family)